MMWDAFVALISTGAAFWGFHMLYRRHHPKAPPPLPDMMKDLILPEPDDMGWRKNGNWLENGSVDVSFNIATGEPTMLRIGLVPETRNGWKKYATKVVQGYKNQRLDQQLLGDE